ncbi:Phospholipase D delta [Hibiscus syriacus]|uniref:Phospholipase D n=1 Tax=Hibiscus syriacus TaxID=106335 RepID=A0A6A2Z1K6_HIBSY|nr:Phospholipase D delta [Hibiscus syriacus]
MAEEGSQELIYLHGDLDLTIVEARRLPNMDFMANHFRRCVTCEPCKYPSDAAAKERDTKLHGHRKFITSDPYVTVCLPQATVARTRVLKNSQNPKWNERFIIPLAHPVNELEINVKDNDLFGSEAIGTAKIPASRIATGEHITGWFPLIGPKGKPPKKDSSIYLDMTFTPCEKNPLYKQGVASDPELAGVRQTYFPLRKGNQVTLYQDAHVRGREPTRPLPRGGNLTLGELLKYKSEEGVRVLLLVWDDKTSRDKFAIRTAGVMQTHDEETLKFFKHSSVTCVLAPRYASSKLGFPGSLTKAMYRVVGTMFTHHQKCVLVDTQGVGNNRKITAFVGGIDLCDGRYDTPEHRLLRELDTVFKDDFHNPTFPAGTKAPRQPWHDLHTRIEGPAAYDVLINFEQRWRKSTKWKEFSLLFKGKSHWNDDSLIRIERISWIQSPLLGVADDGTTIVPEDDPKVHVLSKDDRENWDVQIFRSIDSGSLKGFPKYIERAQNQNLTCAKNLVIDKSIQTAYIQAIRSAQHYIYIENQYFLGSSYAWPSYKNAGADNLIPMELALKVASKIRARERFAVYIIIPLWPEGDPKTATVQEILYWQVEFSVLIREMPKVFYLDSPILCLQSQTMQMMYEVVAQELKFMQIKDAHPRDYLNFYCLGNREEVSQEMLNGSNSVSDSAKFGRFMIYVHAKGMIVDDEYVIVGSANINQRSMAGTKDTEIAMGAYQPHYTWAKKKYPRGQVHGYRMSLWAEHLGEINKLFKEPESLDCVKTVNGIAEENWTKFTNVEYSPLQGHLLMYPVQVDVDGKVNPLPGYENFPDVGGNVLGVHSIQLPDVLTT